MQQPGAHRVAAWITWGCSLAHLPRGGEPHAEVVLGGEAVAPLGYHASQLVLLLGFKVGGLPPQRRSRAAAGEEEVPQLVQCVEQKRDRRERRARQPPRATHHALLALAPRLVTVRGED